MDLCGIERGGDGCWSGAGVVGLRFVEIVERKANCFEAFSRQTFDCTLIRGSIFDLLQSLTPFAVRLFQVVCGQPAFLGATVLKTVLRNPAGHFPPPDPGAVAMLEVCCGCSEVIDPDPDVESEV